MKNMEYTEKNSSKSYHYAGISETDMDLLGGTSKTITNTEKNRPIGIQYFTDPLSPSGFAMERELEKLSHAYNDLVNIEYHMGGLMPLWELYRNNGISTHADMARHWKNAGELYNLPITGSVWFVDPPYSSFPASIAFKSAQLQSRQKALRFLRRIREMLFLENINMSKWQYLEAAAMECKLDIDQLKKDQVGTGRRLFEEDLSLAQKLEVMGFPTLIMMGADGDKLTLEGFQKLDQIELSLNLLSCPQTVGEKR